MFKTISWAEYISFIFILLVIYYAVIIYRYFGMKFLLFFAERNHNLPTTQLELFDERNVRDEHRAQPEAELRSSAAPDNLHANRSDTSIVSEIETLLQNLSFFSPGEKNIVQDSLRDLLNDARCLVTDDVERKYVSSEIIRLAESYCEVVLSEDEAEKLFQVKVHP
jgi:hypothetical protein